MCIATLIVSICPYAPHGAADSNCHRHIVFVLNSLMIIYNGRLKIFLPSFFIQKAPQAKSNIKASNGKPAPSPRSKPPPIRTESISRSKKSGVDPEAAAAPESASRPESGGGATNGTAADEGLVGVGITLVWKRAQPQDMTSPGRSSSRSEPGPGRVRIKKIRGPPASLSELQPGDELLGVDGRPVAGEEHRAVVGWLQGRLGEPVTLTVARGDRTWDVPLVRCRQPPPSTAGDAEPPPPPPPLAPPSARSQAAASAAVGSGRRRAAAEESPQFTSPRPPAPAPAAAADAGPLAFGFEIPFFTRKGPPAGTRLVPGEFEDDEPEGPPARPDAADGAEPGGPPCPLRRCGRVFVLRQAEPASGEPYAIYSLSLSPLSLSLSLSLSFSFSFSLSLPPSLSLSLSHTSTLLSSLTSTSSHHPTATNPRPSTYPPTLSAHSENKHSPAPTAPSDTQTLAHEHGE